jgi:hypothetical protein
LLSAMSRLDVEPTTTPFRFSFVGVVVDDEPLPDVVVDPLLSTVPPVDANEAALALAVAFAAAGGGVLEPEDDVSKVAEPPDEPLSTMGDGVCTEAGTAPPVTSAMICRAVAAALEPTVTGPTATPINVPQASIPVARIAVAPLPGGRRIPVRPNAWSAIGRPCSGWSDGSGCSSGADWRDCLRAPHATQ